MTQRLSAEVTASKRAEADALKQCKQVEMTLQRATREAEAEREQVGKKLEAEKQRAARLVDEEKAKASKLLEDERKRAGSWREELESLRSSAVSHWPATAHALQTSCTSSCSYVCLHHSTNVPRGGGVMKQLHVWGLQLTHWCCRLMLGCGPRLGANGDELIYMYAITHR